MGTRMLQPQADMGPTNGPRAKTSSFLGPRHETSFYGVINIGIEHIDR